MILRAAAGALTAALTVLAPHPTGAGETWLGEIRDGFDGRLVVQASAAGLRVRDSDLNPQNFLGLPEARLALEVRPDLRLNVRRFRFGFQPRFAGRAFRTDRGSEDATWDTDTDAYVHAWWAQLRAASTLFVSYGRENLQWGPSYLLSPSNPFNRNNGQNNPQVDVEGLEYAQALWIPDAHWSVSLIANTGQGRLTTFETFERAYAVKLDCTGGGVFAGAIGSIREDGTRGGVGGFAGWYPTDAVILHAEGRWEESGFDGLAGGVYTFESGLFVVAEYFRDGDGCRSESIAGCFNPFFGRSDPAEVLFRRHYIFTQITDPSPWTRGSLTARWIAGLDDGSHRWIGLVEHELGDRWIAFLVGVVDRGERRDEFGSLIEGAAMAGVTVAF
jgi:hypothetical protein